MIPETSSDTPVVPRTSPNRNWRSGAGAWLPDLRRSVENLMMHKLRSLLTMLGMIFGVAAVLSMLSIGADAQQEVMAVVEDLGRRKLNVAASRRVGSAGPGPQQPDLRADGRGDIPPRRHL